MKKYKEKASEYAHLSKEKASEYAHTTKGVLSEWFQEAKAYDYTKLWTKGQRDRSFAVALLPVIVTIAAWPVLGFYRQKIFTSYYPYPLTIGFLTCVFCFVIGSGYFFRQCLRRGFICCGFKHNTFQEIHEDQRNSIKMGEKPKGPVTLGYCFRRFFHWGFFPGLFLSIFLYSSATAYIYCGDNPNLCTVLFRADLFLWTLLFLAIINSPQRATRLDWLAALINLLGISFLGWNSKYGVQVDFGENAKIFLAGALIVVSFGAYPIMLKKATIDSGIMKVVWIQSFYAGIFLMILSLSFEGIAPWWAAHDQGNAAIVWHVFLFVVILAVWMWAMAMTVAYSDTITTSLAISFSLFLGDFGIASYITDGYTFEWKSGVGLILVLISAAWLLKRMIAINCAESCGKYCDWGNNGIVMDEHDGGPLMDLPEYTHGTYGSAGTSNPTYVDLSERDYTEETPITKKKGKKKAKKLEQQGVELV